MKKKIPKILLLGGHGKLGSYLWRELKKIGKFEIYRSKKGFRYVLDQQLGEVHGNFNIPSVIEKVFKDIGEAWVVDLLVTRNHISNPNIRDVNTSLTDILRSVNISKKLNSCAGYVFISSISVHAGDLEGYTKAERILKSIVDFIEHPSPFKIQEFRETTQQFFQLSQWPLPEIHRDLNLRMNGQSKFISEQILKMTCRENKIPLLIARPFRIIEYE